ncbi:serine protease inhibitor swm-1-like [Pseudophryne corroboree]|uniref:serine protease inhibitor swm-1-like n=1 Tax=Pseudophryne corroboree TaxID=495146 RepID=UPI0030815C54
MALTPMHLLVTFSVAALLIYVPKTTNSQTTTMQCGENQEYKASESDCPTCSNYRTPRTCPPGCACKEGFLPDDNGDCVEKAVCESCKGNTTYNSCAFPCGGRCEDIGKPPQICNIPICKGGCVCKEGFLLDAIGNCVEKSMCESCTGNTTYSSCAYACGRLCEDIGKPTEKCFIPLCRGGCVCKQEYWYLNNTCVLQKDCPS